MDYSSPSSFFDMPQISRVLASKEQDLKNLANKMGNNASTEDLLKFQAKMNEYNQFVTIVSNSQAEQAKTLKGIIDNVH